jgi:hypothetical protein
MRTRKMVAHKDSRHYILNHAALHNYKSIYECLPQSFPPTSKCRLDHESIRLEMAAHLRDKKKQVQEAKEAQERVVMMGRTAGTTASQSQALGTATETLTGPLHRHMDASNSQPTSSSNRFPVAPHPLLPQTAPMINPER